MQIQELDPSTLLLPLSARLVPRAVVVHVLLQHPGGKPNLLLPQAEHSHDGQAVGPSVVVLLVVAQDGLGESLRGVRGVGSGGTLQCRLQQQEGRKWIVGGRTSSRGAHLAPMCVARRRRCALSRHRRDTGVSPRFACTGRVQ